MNAPLHNAAVEWSTLKSDLIAMFGGGDDEALCDTLEGMSSFPDLAAATIRSALEDEAFAEGLGNLIAQMQARKQRLEARSKAKRELVERAMILADQYKLPFPDMTLSLVRRPAFVQVTDKDLVPAEFFSTPKPEIRTSKIKAALDKGQDVPGAHLSNGGIGLTIRRV